MWFFVSIFTISIGAMNARADDLRIAAATDLKFALDEIVERYHHLHPSEKIVVTYGSSGKLAAQVREGAPFDIFFSADTEKPEAIAHEGRTEGPTFLYAHGHVVLWVRQESKVTLDGLMKCLFDPGVTKIAIANALTAPYGVAAETALKRAGLWEKVSGKIIKGENVSQAAQYVESSAADIGLIAESLAMSPTLKKEGRFVEVDSSLSVPLSQAGVLLKGKNSFIAKKFREFLLGSEGKKILASFGLSP
jgi:molybdate transport system substrate-binding protein